MLVGGTSSVRTGSSTLFASSNLKLRASTSQMTLFVSRAHPRRCPSTGLSPTRGTEGRALEDSVCSGETRPRTRGTARGLASCQHGPNPRQCLGIGRHVRDDEWHLCDIVHVGMCPRFLVSTGSMHHPFRHALWRSQRHRGFSDSIQHTACL